jgi:ABC-type lipoprotein export system ATPase subunit
MSTDQRTAEFEDDKDDEFTVDDTDDLDDMDERGEPLDEAARGYKGADLYEDDEEDEDEDEDDGEDGEDEPGHGAGTDIHDALVANQGREIPVAGAATPLPAAAAPVAPAQMTGPIEQPALPVTVVAEGLRKEFVSGGEVVPAVDGVSFSFTTRQFVAITGPSGCGKTTLLYLLGSLEQATAGRLLIDGVDVAALRGKAADLFRRKSIGFVFQSFYLIPNLTALENVMLPMEVAGVPKTQRHERAAFLLQQVGLPANRYHHRPTKLSGGQQQRVAIARALANDPAVILADEPTGNLDSFNSKRLVSLLHSLAKQGRTIIMVTHDRGIARLADVRMELMDGRIVKMTKQADSDDGNRPREVEPTSKRRKRGRGGRQASGRRR